MPQENNSKKPKTIKSNFTRIILPKNGENTHSNWGEKSNNTSPKNKK